MNEAWQIFWVDMVLELESDAPHEEEESGSQGPLGRALSPWLDSPLSRDSRAEELAAAPDIASGILQVLVVEARDLRPVHGIGTNPYVRARLGEHLRRSHTVWSAVQGCTIYILYHLVVHMCIYHMHVIGL